MTTTTTAPAWERLSGLERFKSGAAAGQYTARCPEHEDRNASLSIRVDDDGKILLHCFAGCEVGDIVAAIGCTLTDLFPPTASNGHASNGHDRHQEPRQKGRPGTGDQEPRYNVRAMRYELRDAAGTLVGVHGRTDWRDAKGERHKRMWWERHHGRSSEAMPLYRLPHLLAAPADAEVIVCEGEMSADAAARAGLLAVGTVTGASGTPDDDALRPLVGHAVILWPDNDAAGAGHMLGIAARLVALGAAAPRWVAWPDAPEKGDAADYFGNGGTARTLADLIVDAPPEEEAPSAPDRAVLPFPVAVFPAPFRRLVEEGAAALKCPPEFLGVPLLVLAGTAIGATRCLELRQDWHEYPNIWAATVAEPGSAKSPALKLVSRPLSARQRALKVEYERERAAYDLATQRYEVDQAAWRKAGSGDPPEKPHEPVMGQVMTTDATREAMTDILRDNPRGVVFHQDELTAWALAMNQYKGGRGSDRQNWCSYWNGAEVMENRRGRRPVYLPWPFVAVEGAIPPAMLGELADESGREDGFLHRVLFAYPDPLPPPRWTKDTVPAETLASVSDLFDHLWALTATQDASGDAAPVVVSFTTDGYQTWVEWYDDHAGEQSSPGFPANLRGPWAKLRGYGARLALVLQLCRFACAEAGSEDVDAVSMTGAAALIDYFKSHARRVYAHLHATPDDLRLIDAVEWIRRQPGGRTTARDVQRAGLRGVANADEAKRLLLDLAERGYGLAQEINQRGGKRVTFTLHHPTPDR